MRERQRRTDSAPARPGTGRASRHRAGHDRRPDSRARPRHGSGPARRPRHTWNSDRSLPRQLDRRLHVPVEPPEVSDAYIEVQAFAAPQGSPDRRRDPQLGILEGASTQEREPHDPRTLRFVRVQDGGQERRLAGRVQGEGRQRFPRRRGWRVRSRPACTPQRKRTCVGANSTQPTLRAVRRACSQARVQSGAASIETVPQARTERSVLACGASYRRLRTAVGSP